LLSTTLDVIALLVPPDGYGRPFIARKLAHAGEFCASISPFIAGIILEKIGCESQALRILAAIVRGMRPPRWTELERTLLALVPGLLPDVFLVLRNLRDKLPL
jgi:hypothetical protein